MVSAWKIKRYFFSLSNDHDNELTFIDSSIGKAHQHSSGGAYGAKAAIGKSVEENTTNGTIYIY